MKIIGAKYQLIHIPTTMLASLLRFSHSLMNPEMPVHVGGLLFLAFFI
jgi:hypothetical protein